MEEEDIYSTEGEPYPVKDYLEKHKDIPQIGAGIGGPIISGGVSLGDSDDGDGPVLLTNLKPMQGAMYPHECHDFYNKATAVYEITTEGGTEQIGEHVSYHMTGGYPMGLTIDHDTGVISGTINPFNMQPILGCGLPEKIRIDGSNWMNMGRPQARSITFTFGVYTVYKPLSSGESGGGLPSTSGASGGLAKSAIRNFSIKVIRTNDMDNLIFGIAYMATQETAVAVNDRSGIPGAKSLYILKHNLNVYNKSFEVDNCNGWIATHPGPFPRCQNIQEYFLKIFGLI